MTLSPHSSGVPHIGSQNFGSNPACLHNSFAVILSNRLCLFTGIVLIRFE